MVQQSRLGNQLSVSRMGLGCMGMSEFYGTTDDAMSEQTLRRAVELGINFFDTADIYGHGKNEELLGAALKAVRKDVVIATKCGIVRRLDSPASRGVNGTPTYVRESCEKSLLRLKTDYIDLYYLHRIDYETPIEDTVGALSLLIKEGKIRHYGLSEPNVDVIRRAHKTHPMCAVQNEYSLWTRVIERNGILDLLRELGIGLVAYSPMGRGFLTGKIVDAEALPHGDSRKGLPRFMRGNIEKNLKLVESLQRMADQKGCTTAQLALAFVLHQGEDIVPIPGTKRIAYLEENWAAQSVHLNAEELSQLKTLSHESHVFGERYTPKSMTAYHLKE